MFFICHVATLLTRPILTCSHAFDLLMITYRSTTIKLTRLPAGTALGRPAEWTAGWTASWSHYTEVHMGFVLCVTCEWWLKVIDTMMTCISSS